MHEESVPLFVFLLQTSKVPKFPFHPTSFTLSVTQLQYFFLFPFSKFYESRIVALHLKEIASRINWKGFHPSFIQQINIC